MRPVRAVSFGRYDYHAVAGSLPVGRYGGLVFENRYVFDAVRIELVYEIGATSIPSTTQSGLPISAESTGVPGVSDSSGIPAN